MRVLNEYSAGSFTGNGSTPVSVPMGFQPSYVCVIENIPYTDVNSPAAMVGLRNYALGANSTITNASAGTYTGDLFLSPGTSVTGFPTPGVLSGTQQVANGAASTAQTALTALIIDLQGRTTTEDLTGQDLGGLTKGAGVYNYASSAGLTGTLTLDGQGNADAIFIFKMGSTLTTASSSVVALINGAQAGNVYWVCGSSATLGTSSTFKGIIAACTSITATTSANIAGNLFARDAAVTVDGNVVAAQSPTAPGPNPAGDGLAAIAEWFEGMPANTGLIRQGNVLGNAFVFSTAKPISPNIRGFTYTSGNTRLCNYICW